MYIISLYAIKFFWKFYDYLFYLKYLFERDKNSIHVIITRNYTLIIIF